MAFKVAVELVRPASEHLASYKQALERGWSPDNLSSQVAAEHLAHISSDPEGLLASLEDREEGGTIALPDGREVPRLPWFHRWMWDGEFCGSINLRWKPGTADLPPYCLGHIGYGVVPWKRGHGHATRALALILPEARALKLPYVELTTDISNTASRRVIEANGGVIVERFFKHEAYGGAESFRYRISL
jgi:predicted acetyltransferase